MRADTRETVLGRIRSALADGARPPLPPAMEFEASSLPLDALAQRFSDELRALGGEAMVVADPAACAREVEAYCRARGVRRVATQSSPLAQEIGSALSVVHARRARGLSLAELEQFDAGLVEARALVAESGSAILLASSYEDRLLPYLPRISIVVSPIARLHASVSAGALEAIETASQARERGEAVIVTGPSRTADIEKELVLGAHGPVSVAVFVIR